MESNLGNAAVAFWTATEGRRQIGLPTAKRKLIVASQQASRQQ